MQIGLWGDIHGDYPWVRLSLPIFAARGITRVIQVGDFGIYSGFKGSKFLRKTAKLAQTLGIDLYVVPGNHEDWVMINDLTDEATDFVTLWPGLHIAPRVHRWEWDGVAFASLSGAPSVDRHWRQQAQAADPIGARNYWFAEEAITPRQALQMAEGGRADVMICHDAPNGISTIEREIGHNPHGFAAADILYAAEGRLRLDEAFRGVSPDLFIHGHYHFKVDEIIPSRGRIGSTRIFGLECNNQEFNLGMFDTETYEVEHISIFEGNQSNV